MNSIEGVDADTDALVSSATSVEITAYRLEGRRSAAFDLKASPKTRAWMDASDNRFAYRCLPLVMANQMGWVIESPVSITATWNGSQATDGISITIDDDDEAVWKAYVMSHFGSGIITFSIPYLFRTSPGTGLLVRGCPNHFIDNASPLEGFVETEWLDLTFTMNWKIMEAGKPCHFKKGDPICFVQPYQVGLLENCTPRVLPIDADANLRSRFRQMSKSRREFNADPKRGTSWQKDYYKGQSALGAKAPEHRTKVALPRFYKEENNGFEQA